MPRAGTARLRRTAGRVIDFGRPGDGKNDRHHRPMAVPLKIDVKISKHWGEVELMPAVVSAEG